MRGIILAGGYGERLYPMTEAISKQLLPIYDKPMIYYPLSTLMSLGIREILIITTRRDQENFQRLLGTGEQWGVCFTYKVQEAPRGLAEAFLIGADFIGREDVALILGDNLFCGIDFQREFPEITGKLDGAVICGYQVREPWDYGVIRLDPGGEPIAIEEKPKNPGSQYAVPGLYFYDHTVVEIAETIRPSSRGELEITDVNDDYLKRKKLKVHLLEEGAVWMDAGMPKSLLEAGNFIAAFQHRRGIQIGCVEEIAYRQGWIDDMQLIRLAERYGRTEYGRYVQNLTGKGEATWGE